MPYLCISRSAHLFCLRLFIVDLGNIEFDGARIISYIAPASGLVIDVCSRCNDSFVSGHFDLKKRNGESCGGSDCASSNAAEWDTFEVSELGPPQRAPRVSKRRLKVGKTSQKESEEEKI